MKRLLLCTLALLITGCNVSTDSAREMDLALLSKIAHNAPVRKDYSSQESFDKASYDYYEKQGSFKTITTVRYLRYSNSCSGFPFPILSLNEKRHSEKPMIGQVSGDPLVCIEIPSDVLKGSKYKEVVLYYDLVPKHSSSYNKITKPCKMEKGDAVESSDFEKCRLLAGNFSAVISGKEYSVSYLNQLY